MGRPRYRLVGIHRTLQGVTPQLDPEPIPAIPADEPEGELTAQPPRGSRVVAGLNSAVHLAKAIAFSVVCLALVVLTVALAPILFLSIPAGIFAFGCGVNAVANFLYAFGHGAIAVSPSVTRR